MPQTRHNVQSHSQLQTVAQASDDSSTLHLPATLRLRGEDDRTTSQTNQGRRSTRQIKWSEDVIDNEGMGKKSSKVCCIYHKPRPVGESSSESESSSDSDSDSDSDSCDGHGHSYDNDPRHNRNQVGGPSTSGQPAGRNQEAGCCPRHRGNTARKQRRSRSPNAYEKMPKTTRRRG